MAIKRIWHGWTTRENADGYEAVVRGEVIPAIEALGIEGYRGLELLRNTQNTGDDEHTEIEFATIMTFDSLDSIIDFQGEDYTRAHVPDAAQRYLKRWNSHAAHYELLKEPEE